MHSEQSPEPASPPTLTQTRALTPQTKVSVVIPCFNEQDVLPLLYEQLDAEAGKWGMDYEVVLINDGSRDRTWQMMREIHARNSRWKMLSLSRNFGHQIALWTGLCAASGDIVVVLDADLQDPPDILPPFFEKWAQGYDVIYGVRRRRKENIFKRTAYFVFYRLLSMMATVSIPLDTGDFCVMDKHIVDIIRRSRERRPFIRGLRAWAGFKQLAMPYERKGRAAGEPKYTLRKLFALAFDGILSSSIQPLRVASYLGIVVSVMSFLGAVFTLLQRIFADQFAAIGLRPVPGFATIVIAVLFIGGVQLLCVGILGEYIGRVYESVQGRPPSLVAETLGVPDPVNQPPRA